MPNDRRPRRANPGRAGRDDSARSMPARVRWLCFGGGVPVKRLLLALTLAASLSGCATIGQVASSKETFVACQVVDVATTVAIVGGGGTELNPLMAKLISHGWLPFIAYKAALVWLVYRMDWSPPVQAAVNVAACLPVPYNLGNL